MKILGGTKIIYTSSIKNDCMSTSIDILFALQVPSTSFEMGSGMQFLDK